MNLNEKAGTLCPLCGGHLASAQQAADLGTFQQTLQTVAITLEAIANLAYLAELAALNPRQAIDLNLGIEAQVRRANEALGQISRAWLV